MMTEDYTMLLLPGDGIGPEVVAEAERVIGWLGTARRKHFRVSYALVGGAAIDAVGEPLPADTVAQALAADAVLLGAVGGPKWVNQPFDKRPEHGIIGLRKAMDVYANLRPAICFPALADASSLKRELIEGLDIMFVRELVGGVYFGEPRGIETLPNGERRGVNTQVYTTSEIHRIARVAFELARKRTGKVCSAEKSNVMESGLLWRQEVQVLRDAEYPDIDLSHMLADNCAMQLVKYPKQFDVIVTDNLFGDLLSDEAGMLSGSLGMLPSASIGSRRADGRLPGLYEPIHGSAPDIAGQGIANPCATLLSLAMALRYSFGLDAEADLLERAISGVLADGIRTGDVMAPGCAKVGTRGMGDAILAKLKALA
jgi:3-isopropylmalate dehydrogenase